VPQSLSAQLDAVRERWNVLRHPFYARWSRGELTHDELAFYAGQYRHAVVALAVAAARAGSPHAGEERAHVALWDEFAAAIGGDAGADALPETEACAEAWAGERRDELASLAALYAIESAQPAISETKRAGLLRFYGCAPDSEATRYFDVHATRDVEHAAEGLAELEARATHDDVPRLVAEAERVLKANWELLDGVERAGSRARPAERGPHSPRNLRAQTGHTGTQCTRGRADGQDHRPRAVRHPARARPAQARRPHAERSGRRRPHRRRPRRVERAQGRRRAAPRGRRDRGAPAQRDRDVERVEHAQRGREEGRAHPRDGGQQAQRGGQEGGGDAREGLERLLVVAVERHGAQVDGQRQHPPAVDVEPLVELVQRPGVDRLVRVHALAVAQRHLPQRVEPVESPVLVEPVEDLALP
jgi:pyrroloquinoline-quinone synthase